MTQEPGAEPVEPTPEEVTVTEGRARFGDLVIAAQEAGRQTGITRYGRPAALLVPYTADAVTVGRADLLAVAQWAKSSGGRGAVYNAACRLLDDLTRKDHQ